MTINLMLYCGLGPDENLKTDRAQEVIARLFPNEGGDCQAGPDFIDLLRQCQQSENIMVVPTPELQIKKLGEITIIFPDNTGFNETELKTKTEIALICELQKAGVPACVAPLSDTE